MSQGVYGQDRARWHYLRGIRLAKYERVAASDAAFRTAERLHPQKSGWAYFHRGGAYHGQKKYDLALADHNKALTLEPDYAIGYNNRGYLYHVLKKYDLALKDYEEALKIEPYNAIVLDNRGQLYFAQKQYDLALADYRAYA